MGRTHRRVASLFVIVSLALALPGRAALALTDQQRAHRAIGYLAHVQEDNGSIPGFSPIGSTADAILAIRSADVGADVEQAAIRFLRRQTVRGNVDTIGLKAKVVLALAATGRNAHDFGGHDLVGEITETEGLNGRYGDATIFDQALAILAIYGSTTSIDAQAVTWLRDGECPDGGWQFDRPHRAAEGTHCGDPTNPKDFFRSDTNTTAYAVMALALPGAGWDGDPFGFFSRIRDDAQGGWGYTWGFTDTDANSTALVIQAYAAAEVALPDGALHALRHLQYPRCGAFAFSLSAAGTRTAPNPGATIGAVPGLLQMELPIVQSPPHVIGPAPKAPRCT
jgi:hypothetical protein